MVPENVEEIINNTPPKQSKGSINLTFVEGVERFVLTSFFRVNHRITKTRLSRFLIFFSLAQGDFELPFKSIISTARFAQLFLCQFCLISKTFLVCVRAFSFHIPKSHCCVNKAHFLDSLIRNFSLCFDKARVNVFFTVPGFLDRLHKNVQTHLAVTKASPSKRLDSISSPMGFTIVFISGQKSDIQQRTSP